MAGRDRSLAAASKVFGEGLLGGGRTAHFNEAFAASRGGVDAPDVRMNYDTTDKMHKAYIGGVHVASGYDHDAVRAHAETIRTTSKGYKNNVNYDPGK